MDESAVSKQPAANLSALVEDALEQAKTLVRAELSLAGSELKSELSRALRSALLLGAGAMFLQAALLTTSILLVLMLGGGLASLGVVLAFVAIAALLLLLGVRSTRHQKLPRTTARLSNDAKQVLEAVK